ncbi:MAG: L-seryl-tRNA(Sec) selenium transferase [Actinomycetia bacterium]|nr:L-seryl-tRNA(Sec) selenium transferase [Actinomycetes bacterium]
MTRPPSVDQLARALAPDLPHPLAVEVARQAIQDDQVDEIDELARLRRRRLLTPVINATGVLLHTNLGRAPIANETAATYSNLELDLASGSRGSRQQAVGSLLACACGAEAAMVVNNCASAVMLSLAAVAGRGPVGVSRGEMVEIGGAFRVPDVMALSGAALVEVGTTNRTRLGDYRSAVEDQRVGSVLKVHQSNYRIVGFTEDTSVAALASLDVPVLVDIGSGLLDANCPWLTGPPPPWLEGEPAARQTLETGADLVMFSGDKLFGGPQAGIIAGRKDLVDACGRHPLARALRPGSLVLSALQETTLAYLRRDGDAIPFWRMATIATDVLQARADALAAAVANAPSSTSGDTGSAIRVRAIATEAMAGGGTLPTVTMASAGVAVEGDHTASLRNRERPIIARVDANRTILDLRTVDPGDDTETAQALAELATPLTPGGVR